MTNKDEQSHNLDESPPLCEQCKELVKSAREALTFRRWEHRSSQLYRTSLPFHSDSSCKFCELIEQVATAFLAQDTNSPSFIVVPFMHWPYPDRYLTSSLQTADAFALLDTDLKIIHNTNYSERACIDIYPEESDIGFGRDAVRSPLIDFSRLRNVIETCEKDHDNCNSSQSVLGKPKANLKVIDCGKRTIAALEAGSQYVTLSYVWGQCAPTEMHGYQLGAALPDVLPAVIEDAIEITRRLGYSYLWIDRYCINQQEQTDVHVQISQMDLIYGNAVCCIIAAAAEDTSCALPGVIEPRPVLGTLSIDDLVYVGTPPAKHLAGHSVWNSRGWTYQEAVLSSRRIIIEKEKVYFECSTLHSWETVPGYQKQPWRQSNWPRVLLLDDSSIWSDHARADEYIWQAISDYNRRAFTYGRDAVLAFQGVFSSWRAAISRQNKHPDPSKRRLLEVFFGLPLWMEHASLDEPLEDYDLALARSLCSWNYFNERERRIELPTWTWAGLESAVESFTTFFYAKHASVRLKVHPIDGESVDWADYCAKRLDNIDSSFRGDPIIELKPVLTIHGPCFSILKEQRSPWGTDPDWEPTSCDELRGSSSSFKTFIDWLSRKPLTRSDLIMMDLSQDIPRSRYEDVSMLTFLDRKTKKLHTSELTNTNNVTLMVPMAETEASDKYWYLLIRGTKDQDQFERVGAGMRYCSGTPISDAFQQFCEGNKGYRELSERGIRLI